MTKFKVGDRVQFIWDGDEGPVKDIDPVTGLIWVEFDGDGYDQADEGDLELVEPASDEEPPLQDWEKDLLLTPFEQSVNRITGDIAKLLIEKNKAYGDSALNPVRVFSKASRTEQLNVRIDDKISRIQRGTEYGDEDTVRDLAGYLVMLLIARESE